MIDIENPDEIYEWDIGKLWNAFQVMLEKEDDEGTEYRTIYYNEEILVRKGIRIKIPIQYIINEWYEEYPHTKKIKISGHGKYKLIDFEEEKEERERIMRRIILDNLEDGENTTPRGKT